MLVLDNHAVLLYFPKTEVSRMQGLKLAFSFLVVVGLIGCFAAAQEKIVVGSIWDFVGYGAEIGQASYRGSLLAVELINAQGGIWGIPVEYINIDGQSTLDVIAAAAKRLCEEFQVLGAVGSEDDSLTSASGPVFQANRTVFLTGTATTPTQPYIGEYIFMPAYGDHLQGIAAAKYCVQVLGWRHVALLYDAASAYSTYLLNVFKAAFEYFTGDPKSIVTVEAYMTGDVVFTAQLTRIKALEAQIDAVVTFPPVPQDAPVYTKQARALGIKVPFFYTDGADDISLITIGGPAVEGSFLSTQFAVDMPLTDNAKKFIEAFTNKYGTPPSCFEAVGYDAMMLLLEAIYHVIEEVGVDAWKAMSLQVKRDAIRDMLQKWPQFTWTTVPISFPDPTTAIYPRCPDKPVFFKVVKEGRMVYAGHMWPQEIANDIPPILAKVKK
jgi:branched-chain amino acid transport system substrate-binding protein